MWTTKHLAQASCTELTLTQILGSQSTSCSKAISNWLQKVKETVIANRVKVLGITLANISGLIFTLNNCVIQVNIFQTVPFAQFYRKIWQKFSTQRYSSDILRRPENFGKIGSYFKNFRLSGNIWTLLPCRISAQIVWTKYEPFVHHFIEKRLENFSKKFLTLSE